MLQEITAKTDKARGEAIKALCANSNKLSQGDNKFASSLIQQWFVKGSLSDKQWDWVFKLSERATLPQKPEAVAPGARAAFFAAINPLAKRPALIIPAGDDAADGVLRIEKKIDYLAVHWRKAMKSGVWSFVGSIRDGDVIRASGKGLKYAGLSEADLVGALEDFGEDATAVLKVTGAMFGICGCCGKVLEHPASVALGIGPVCAGYLGLSDQWSALAAKAKAEGN